MNNDQPTYNGYANQASLDFEVWTANNAVLYEPVLAFAQECLRRVPGMTEQTLGRNIKDNVRILVDMALEGERLRFLGWGEGIVIEDQKALTKVLLDMARDIGLDNWSDISETDTGASWMESAQGIEEE